MGKKNKKIKVAVWSCARISSKRCPSKMVRNFCGTTLTDIFLKKLQYLKNKNIDVFFAGYEKTFKTKCQKYKIPFVQRSKKSATVDEPAFEIYKFLLEQKFDYFLQVNACMPFLKAETIYQFLKKCIKLKKPCFAVYRVNNYFLDLKNRPINFSNNIETINTKKVKNIKEFAHAFYFFKKNYFEKNKWYWNWKKLTYIDIDKSQEIFDIDTEYDFKLAESLYKNN